MRKASGSGLQILTPVMVRMYAAKGMTLREIGLMHGYSGQRVGQVIGADSELKEAWETGNAELCDTLTSALMRLVAKDNVIAILFALKSRCGWIEAQYLLNKPDTTQQPQVNVYLPDNNRTQPPISIDNPSNELHLNH